MDGLKAGDEVAICNSFRIIDISKVERTTKTLIIFTGTNLRFSRKTGRQVGPYYGCPFIVEPTPAIRGQFEKQQLMNWIKNISSSRESPPLEALRAMREAYKKAVE